MRALISRAVLSASCPCTVGKSSINPPATHSDRIMNLLLPRVSSTEPLASNDNRCRAPVQACRVGGSPLAVKERQVDQFSGQQSEDEHEDQALAAVPGAVEP